jgi:sirohydrochlorin cobaltochelatase
MSDSLASPAKGIIVFAHGSRDALWKLPIEAVAQEITRRAPELCVRCAYLELSTPTLSEAANELAAAGVQELTVFPLFLGVGKHAREDLPILMDAVRAAHPDVRVHLMPAAGESPALIAALATIAMQ